MSKYRILEKKGTYKTITVLDRSGVGYGLPDGRTFDTSIGEYEKEVYIPRYIVQEYTYVDDGAMGGGLYTPPTLGWIDLKEFTALVEARKYKKELELVEGIVIE